MALMEAAVVACPVLREMGCWTGLAAATLIVPPLRMGVPEMEIPPPPSDLTWVILAATAGCAAEDWSKWVDGNEYLLMTPRS